MKLVIDIPDKMYEEVKSGIWFENNIISNAIDNGTPLSESEDCVSRQAVLDLANTIETDDYSGNEIVDVVEVEDIEQLPPVKPAEKVGQWIPVSEGLPEKDGDYLVTVKGMRNYIKCCCFALNLYKVDKYDFENKKGVAGFYECDSEYGCYEMTEVIAWCELPEPYKASPTGEEVEE